MDLAPIVDRMERFPAALEALLAHLSPADARWRHDGQGWSIVEIVDHLVDEDQVDFAVRLRLVLEDPDAAWPPIDPEGAVAARRDGERDLGTALARFAELRQAAVTWLRGLEGAEWERAGTHPRAGTLRAGDLLASWADHDLLHLRQLAQRLHLLTERDSGFDPSYAGGSW